MTRADLLRRAGELPYYFFVVVSRLFLQTCSLELRRNPNSGNAGRINLDSPPITRTRGNAMLAAAIRTDIDIDQTVTMPNRFSCTHAAGPIGSRRPNT